MLNRMDSDPSTSTCTINTSHDVRNHKSKKGRTRKKQKGLNKRCSGDSPSRIDILIAKETSPSSSSQLCLLAKGNTEVRGEPSNDSHVSKCDDDAMYNSFMDHIRSLDIMLDKDSDKIKDLSKTNVSLTTKLDKLNESHEELAKKYALLVESNNELLARHNKLVIEHEELTSSYKELENSKFDHLPSNTPSSNDDKPSVAKVDASTSCNDLLDIPCSSSCIDIIVTPYSPLCNELSIVKTNLARENNELKQEVEKLKEDLVEVNKSKVKPSQDNGLPIKKLEKRSTVTCSMCHEGGHKSYKCKLRKKKKEGKEKTTTTITRTIKAKEKKKMTRKKTSISNTHTKKINEGKEETPYLLKKSHDGKVIAYKFSVGDKHWNQPIWVPKDVIINMKGPRRFGFQRILESEGLGR